MPYNFPMPVRFSKMQSLGNDFMIVDATAQTFSPSPEVIARLGDRRTGVGFDQLLMATEVAPDASEIFCRIFNADGGEVMQCGNGVRCLARFAADKGLLTVGAQGIGIKTRTRTTVLEMADDGMIRAAMGQAVTAPERIPFACEGDLMSYPMDVGGREFNIGVLSFGNPHAVVEVARLDDIPVADLGAAMQTHECFPQGVNVEFMQCIDRNTIALRIYERGAGETMACGSGACAAAVIAVRRKRTDSNLRIRMPGGELAAVCDGDSVVLTGPALYVYDGSVET